MRCLAVAAMFLLACGAAQRPVPTAGAISGLARDHDTGEVIAKAQIRIRAQGEMSPRLVVTDRNGQFAIDKLPPGQYSLSALYAGQPIEVSNIIVKRGEPTIVDVMFTLGRPDPIAIDFGNPKDGEIDHFRPKQLAPELSIIEGTVNDAGTRERVSGAVISAVGGPHDRTVQTVSDDQGRYRFEPVDPGTYVVSAYYSISGHGSIEVRRSDIHVAGAEAVFVPLWVELTKQ
ncbi:MAG: hypothetical protein JWO36_6629 [Myxococcales bacterium]|nr:hypothetical protein [Myxococcales bacterium]